MTSTPEHMLNFARTAAYAIKITFDPETAKHADNVVCLTIPNEAEHDEHKVEHDEHKVKLTAQVAQAYLAVALEGRLRSLAYLSMPVRFIEQLIDRDTDAPQLTELVVQFHSVEACAPKGFTARCWLSAPKLAEVTIRSVDAPDGMFSWLFLESHTEGLLAMLFDGIKDRPPLLNSLTIYGFNNSQWPQIAQRAGQKFPCLAYDVTFSMARNESTHHRISATAI